MTTSGIGTSAETTVHHTSTQSDTSVNLSMTPTIMPMVTHPVQTSSGLDTTSSTVKKSNLNVTLSQGTTTETGTSLSQITDTSQLMTSVTISSNQTAISNLAYTTQKTIDPKSPTTDTMSGTSTSQVYVVFRFIKGMLTLFISCENKIVLPFTHIYSFSPKCWKKNSGSFFYSILNKEWSLWFCALNTEWIFMPVPWWHFASV